MTASHKSATWHYEYLPYIMADPDDMTIEHEIPNFRIFPEDAPENYIAETNEHLPGDEQELHARLIVSAPELEDELKRGADIAQQVVDSWEHGDLAAAVRALSQWLVDARSSLDKQPKDNRKPCTSTPSFMATSSTSCPPFPRRASISS